MIQQTDPNQRGRDLEANINSRTSGMAADASSDGHAHEALGENVTSLGGRRKTQSVEDVVKAYFDSIVMQDIPEELEALVRRLG